MLLTFICMMMVRSKIVKIISKQSFQVIFFRYDKNDDDDAKCKFDPLLKM